MKGFWFILGVVTLFTTDTVFSASTTPPPTSHTTSATTTDNNKKGDEARTTTTTMAPTTKKGDDGPSSMPSVGQVIDGLFESTRCPGVQCFKPSVFDQYSNCTPKYENETGIGGAAPSCCPTWVCVGNNGDVSTSSSFTSSSTNFGNNPPPPQGYGPEQGQVPPMGMGQPMGGMGQPMGGMGQPMGGMGQPMGVMGQPMGGMGQQMLGMPLFADMASNMGFGGMGGGPQFGMVQPQESQDTGAGAFQPPLISL